MSVEQTKVVNSVINNKNVIINSVAGSGKTTTCLHICSQMPNKKILILTYNSRLKIESRAKVQLLKLNNVEVHSYHAFCVKYYYDKGHRDDGIEEVINNNYPPKKLFMYDIIILDEVQDMTALFFRYVCKIINDNPIKNIQICSFGDVYQNIYTYAGSDSRFLTHADKIFTSVSTPWDTLEMSTSYRVTKQIATFINTNMLKYERLKTIKSGPNVKYIITDSFSDTYIHTEINKYLKMDYLPEDIFVLGASLKKGKKMSPICSLENKLVLSGIPCHASLSDEAKVDDEVIKGKICFASFHQVKGMERKICIIYGFDESYFNYYAKNLPKDVCPNVLYVALTRASDRLLLIHDYQNNYLPFLDRKSLKTTCDIVTNKNFMGKAKLSNVSISIAVKDLIKNLSNESLNFIFNHVKCKITNKANSSHIQLQSKVQTKNDLYEDVSDINGLAIPAIYEYKNTKKISMLGQILKFVAGHEQIGINSDLKLPDTHKNAMQYINVKHMNNMIHNDDILYIANVYNSLLTGFIGKREQINKYDWLEQNNVDKALKILQKYISSNAQYEKRIQCSVNNKVIIGVIDTIDNNVIWELKCVSTISKEHILQLVIYSYLNERNIAYERDISEIDKMKNYTENLEKEKVCELNKMCKLNDIDLFKKLDATLNNSKKIKKNKADLIMSLIDFKQKQLDHDRISLESIKSSYKLLNILTEEIIEVEYSKDYQIIIDFLLNRDAVIKKDTDNEFINKCLSYIRKVKPIDDVISINGGQKNNDTYMFVEPIDDAISINDEHGNNDTYMFVETTDDIISVNDEQKNNDTYMFI